jgi:heme-degrading monooxygenase HmoA
MIARIWHGATPTARAEEYLHYLEAVGLPGYQGIDGFRGAQILTRTEGMATHFLVVSHWDSMDAVARFAGDPVDQAHYYPRDPEFLLELEPKVVHYVVAART